jgi:hypothetical protein
MPDINIKDTIEELINQGHTPEEISEVGRGIEARRKLQEQLGAIKTKLPEATKQQIAAFVHFVQQGYGMENIEVPAQQLWQAAAEGDTQIFGDALILLAASVYRIRPDLAPQNAAPEPPAPVEIAGPGAPTDTV